MYYKIGEFSTLSKTTIKTLRYYEKEKLLIPNYIDNSTGYRYYETNQLLDLARIISLRQIGITINDIKKVLKENNTNELLKKRKEELNKQVKELNDQLSRINYLMEEKNMKYEVIIKELPDYTVYYKEGIIKDFSKITEFILTSAQECLELNPNMKCIQPDYCYIKYLDNEYKDKDIKIRYAQAVTEKGIENDKIKFKKLKPEKAACIYHKGSYRKIQEAYGFLLNWIKENNYEMTDSIRERYIDGIWNKDNEDDYLTEIQVPISK